MRHVTLRCVAPNLTLAVPAISKTTLFCDRPSDRETKTRSVPPQLCTLLGRKNAGRRLEGGAAGTGANSAAHQMEPADAMARLVSLLLKGEGGFVERWFKVPSSCPSLAGAAELLTPPDTFLWLLGAVGGRDSSTPSECCAVLGVSFGVFGVGGGGWCVCFFFVRAGFRM